MLQSPEKTGNSLMGLLEPSADISNDYMTRGKDTQLQQKTFGFNSKEFKELDEKIKSRSKATKEEVDSFQNLVP